MRCAGVSTMPSENPLVLLMYAVCPVSLTNGLLNEAPNPGAITCQVASGVCAWTHRRNTRLQNRQKNKRERVRIRNRETSCGVCNALEFGRQAHSKNTDLDRLILRLKAQDCSRAAALVNCKDSGPVDRMVRLAKPRSIHRALMPAEWDRDEARASSLPEPHCPA